MTKPLKKKDTFSFVVAVNDTEVYSNNVLASPIFSSEQAHEIHPMIGFPSAGLAYNTGMANSKNDLIVFIHQDVYLPEHWDIRLSEIVNSLENIDKNWGVLGVFGISLDGRPVGHVYSNGLNRILGVPGPSIPAQSLDEMVLVFRRSSKLLFDSALPHFHLYGTDICLESKRRGLSNYVISNFCVHNSISIRRLPDEFWRCAEYLRRKWNHQLPVRTCCINLRSSGLIMSMTRIRNNFAFLRKQSHRFVTERLIKPQDVSYSRSIS